MISSLETHYFLESTSSKIKNGFSEPKVFKIQVISIKEKKNIVMGM